ncbi:hypothetical protein NQ314_004476 [Rhamnusium bicolor]|uniref:RRM domain-containing protein n=1 Tax=Rhamnusium bicolor TaxID=1586634 RepID=A0AAV8ZM34_9CUCU|nr:hypothetical protein NQ314_004476 [Rhamnusium bicolor]
MERSIMSDIDENDRSRERSRRERPSRFSEPTRDRSMDRGRERGSMKSSNNRVYVSNIPYEYRWQDMKDLFRNEVGDVQFVELFLDDNDKPKGSGIVEFSDSASVKKCVEVMQRYEVKGRKLVIKEDFGNVRDKHGAIVGGNKRPRDNDRYRDDHHRELGRGSMNLRQDDGKFTNTYGLSPHFLESLNIDAPLCNKVFVANLEYNVDKKKLKEVFRLAGKVIKVDIPVDKDGRSRGFAVIEYDHPVEAVQAISMLHNQFLFDRPMTVRMDRANETFKLPEGLKTIGMGLGLNGEPLKNVSHNLPSLSGGQQGAGAGILGAVPNNSLQLANALSGLGNVGALNSLGNQQMLQAANLSGLASNLLGNGLGGADLSSLVASAQNPLVSNQATQQLAALASQNSGGNMSSVNSNMPSYGRGGGDNFNHNQSNFRSQSPGQGYNSNNIINSRAFQSQSNSSGGYGGGSGGYGNDRMPFGNSNSGIVRPSSDRGGDKNFSRKVLVSNLPPTTSYKMLHEKFTEYGDVMSFEEKLPGSVLVSYGSDWQAERAISILSFGLFSLMRFSENLDRARIDGRMIDARLY